MPHRRALIVPLENPAELIAGKAAKFGAPIELDLGQRGIRSITQVDGGYLIVAGPITDSGSFALFKWSGIAGHGAILLDAALKDLRPEALFATGSGNDVQLLSDDGGIRVNGIECKKLPQAQHKFRSLIIKP